MRPSARALLEQHLDECAPCLAEYGLDEKLKKLLATKCGGEHAPAGLKERLRQQIRVACWSRPRSPSSPAPDGTVVEVRTTRIERRC